MFIQLISFGCIQFAHYLECVESRISHLFRFYMLTCMQKYAPNELAISNIFSKAHRAFFVGLICLCLLYCSFLPHPIAIIHSSYADCTHHEVPSARREKKMCTQRNPHLIRARQWVCNVHLNSTFVKIVNQNSGSTLMQHIFRPVTFYTIQTEISSRKQYANCTTNLYLKC